MKAKSPQLVILLAAIILVSITFVLIVDATPEKSMEKWTKDHIVKNVKLTQIYKYEEGYLEINEIYSGNELKKKTGIDKFNKEKKIPLETGTVMMNNDGDKLTVKENELILKTKKDGTFKLEKGEEKVHTTKTSLVMTLESEPYQWWDDYNGPQWTWSKILWWYVREDPINLMWGETTISTVEGVLVNEGDWVSNPSEYTHYVYDRSERRWIADDGVAESRYRIFGGNHTRLWEISTNTDVVVIANAHCDDGVFEWPLGHQAIDYEGVEEEVASFYDVGWTVSHDECFLDNEYTNKYRAYNDGNATVITAS
ncbi:hypothetical protein [Methanolobus sp. ZRKC5]|uniref:hypothetical protein n=1 Tax=unclassified Methanolobus TaxID=2629569 RepID=UPI00313ABA28